MKYIKWLLKFPLLVMLGVFVFSILGIISLLCALNYAKQWILGEELNSLQFIGIGFSIVFKAYLSAFKL